mgnify:CR=1 FL=1
MSSAEKIKRLFAKSDVAVHSKVDDRIVSDAFAAFDRSEETTPVSAERSIRRMIMTSTITKLAVAALLIIAVFVGMHQFGSSLDGTSVAFALENAVEALKHVENKHKVVTIIKPPNRYRYDFWTKYSEDGRAIATRFESPDRRLSVCADGVAYSYNTAYDRSTDRIIKEDSVVYISSAKTIDNPPGYVEQMVTEVAEEGGVVKFKTGEENGKKVIVATITFKNKRLRPDKVGDVEYVTIFDAETKLPIRGRGYDIENGQNKLNSCVEFSYNEKLAEDLFKFEIPEGVKVIDQR